MALTHDENLASLHNRPRPCAGVTTKRAAGEFLPSLCARYPLIPIGLGSLCELVTAIRSLAHNRHCVFHPYDWETGHTADERKVIRGDGIALAEGVSVLHPDLAPLYDLRIWVESDPETTLAASLERGCRLMGSRMAVHVPTQRRALIFGLIPNLVRT